MNWIDCEYNTYKLVVIKTIMTIRINWTSDGYRVNCGCRSLKKIFQDLEKAKKAGENFALKLIKEGAKALYI